MEMNAALKLERTLAIIKPHALNHYPAILRRLHLSGFRVLQVRDPKLI